MSLVIFLLVSLSSIIAMNSFSWFHVLRQLRVEFQTLWFHWRDKSFFSKLLGSSFFFGFLAPCAIFTNDRNSVGSWLLIFLILKNMATLSGSVFLFIVLLLYTNLVVEHLLFALLCHKLTSFNDFFQDFLDENSCIIA